MNYTAFKVEGLHHPLYLNSDNEIVANTKEIGGILGRVVNGVAVKNETFHCRDITWQKIVNALPRS